MDGGGRKADNSFGELSRQLRELGPWERHKRILQSRTATSNAAQLPQSDAAALRQYHEFIRSDGGQAAPDASWGERLAARYYNKLLKEYALCDLSRYKEMKVGLRWRTEQEVVLGKGQFQCASVSCTEKQGLSSYEVPFSYREGGAQKQALVKVRVCPACAVKLNWRKEKELKKLAKLVAADNASSKRQRQSRHRSKTPEDSPADELPHDSDASRPNHRQHNEADAASPGPRPSKHHKTQHGPRKESKDKQADVAEATRADAAEDERFDDYLEDMFL